MTGKSGARDVYPRGMTGDQLGPGTWLLGTKSVNRIGFGAMRLTGRIPFGEGTPEDRENAIRVLRRATVELSAWHQEATLCFWQRVDLGPQNANRPATRQCGPRSLSKKFDVHRGTVAAHLERQGILRRVNRRKLTDKNVTKAAGCYEAGQSLEIVGKLFGVSAETMRKELRRAGVALRPRRGRCRNRQTNPAAMANEFES